MNRLSSIFFGMILLALAPQLMAQNDGQSKLDEATDRKIDARTPEDLKAVMDLCEDAIDLGLNEGNLQLAKQLLSASALQRAEMLFQGLPRLANNRDAVRRLRRLIRSDLSKAIENNPELADAFLLMAQIETLPGGNREDAMENLNKAIKLLEDRPVDQSKAYMLRAAMQEKNDEKLEDLAKAIETDPTNARAWQARIALQMAMGKLQEAVEDAEQLMEEDESNMFALQMASESLLGLEKYDEAIAMISRRIDKDPENGDCYRMRARAYSYADKEEEALADLNKAIEINNRDAEALLMRGKLYLAMNEISKADRDISDSLLINPTSVEGIYWRSVVAASESRYSDAIADLELLLSQYPNNPEWVIRLASFYQLDDRPRRGILILDKLLEQSPGEWAALRIRGDCKLAISDHKSAIQDYQEGLRLLEEERKSVENPELTDRQYDGLLNNLAWVLATSPHEELRDGEKSVELGLKACEITNYEQAHILSTLAAGYAEKGDFENARKWSAKAVELGEAEDNEQLEQLKLELESYKQDKPWREEQETEENEKPLTAATETIDT